MPTRRTTPLPPDWPQRRLRVLQRDGYRCQIRLAGCKGRANEVHHTQDPTDHRDAVLISACDSCHATLTGQQAAQARWKKYDRRRPQAPHPGLR